MVLSAIGQVQVEADGSILLPAQKETTLPIDLVTQQNLTASVRWQSFIQKHGQWSVQWNEVTQTPHRAYGKAIQIPGYSLITTENVESASRAFLGDNAAILRINTRELKLTAARQVQGKWYVSFSQEKEGIQVLFSEVELRIFENGQVMAFGADFYRNIELSLTPSISYNEARSLSTKELMFDSATDRINGQEKLYILPRRIRREVEFHLVYKVEITTENPEGNFLAFVDAHSGEIIWRHNRVRYTEVRAKQTGMVQLVLPTDPFVEMDYFDQSITIDGVQLTTDSLGLVTHDITSLATVVAKLEGPWVNVNRQDGPDATITTTISPGDSISLLWDDSNSHPAERDAFYHTNIIHNFITTLDPGFTQINYSMP
jgi:hypothetical protein